MIINKLNIIMKTKIVSIITIIVLITIISISAFASSNKNNTGTVLADVSNFNKIEVRGNVEVYLTDGVTNNVKVYGNYYGEGALVQDQNNVLRIASYTKEKLVIYVTVADLRSLSVYDNAVVKSDKNLSAIELDVNLYDHATADLDLDAYTANIIINNEAKANLSGNVQECNLQQSVSSNVNSAALIAEHLTRKVNDLSATVKNNQELIII